jgi:hypothetical protein
MAPKPHRARLAKKSAPHRHAKSVRLSYVELEGRINPTNLFTVQSASTMGNGNTNYGCVVTADLNHDGFPDAIMSNFGTGYGNPTQPFTTPGTNITVAYGNGTGGFGSTQTLSTGGSNGSFIDVADINGDGWLDAVVTNENGQNAGTVTIFQNNSGSLSKFGNPFATGGYNSAGVRLADVTGDGILDLVIVSFGKDDGTGENVTGQCMTIFQGNADGTNHGDFTYSASPILTIEPDISFIPTAVAVGDFNADGNVDIACTVPGVPADSTEPQPHGSVYVFKGTGAGGFDNPDQYDSGGALPVNIQAADLTGDGKLDLIIANAGDPTNGSSEFSDNSVGVMINTSSSGGSSISWNQSSLTSSCHGTFAVAAADFDMDGKVDIAAINYGGYLLASPNPFVAMFKGNGTGSFTSFSPATYTTINSLDGGQYLAVGDFDHNGSPDLVTVHATPKVVVLLNNTVAGPSVTINQGASQADPTNGSTITYDVVFSEGVTGFTNSDVDLTGSSVTGLSASVTPIDSSHYTVTVSGMANPGSGTVKAKINANAVTSIASSAPNNASTSTDNSVKFDTVVPTVTINQASGQADPASSGPILFTVVFSEPVSGFTSLGVDLSSSSLSGLSAIVTQNTTSNYTVSVSGMSGNGTVVAKVLAGAAIDTATNASAASTSSDNTVTYGLVGPSVTINQGASQADPTNSASIVYDVVFSAGVTGFTSSGVDLSGSSLSGLSALVTPIDSSHYTVTVSGMSGTGTVKATINAGAATAISNGATTQASTSSDNIVTFDNVAPTVTIDQAGGQTDPAASGPISFTVVFSKAVTGFTGADVDLSSSSLTGLSANVTQNTTSNYTVTVTGMSAAGTVVAKVKPNSVTDAAGNQNAASTSTDNTVTYSPATGPAGVISLSSSALAFAEDTGNYSVMVNRTGGTFGSVSATFAVTDGSATAGADYTVTTSPSTLTWADGDATPKFIVLSIIDDTLSEGRETINVQLSNPTNGATIGTAASVLTIKPSDGLPIGKFLQADNDLATIKLTPAGTGGIAQVFLTNGASPISLIELTSTDPNKTVLTMTVKKGGDGTVALGGIEGTGVKSINMPKTLLNGDGIILTGPVQTINLNGISNGADISAVGSIPKKKTRITVKNAIVNGTDITINQPLALLKAAAYGSGGTITAPSIGTVSIKGNFKSNVNVTGAGAGNTSITSFNVLGQVDGSTISVANGNVKTFKVGTFINSQLKVGYTGNNVGNGSFDDPTSTIGTFKTTLKSSAAFKNSSVIAANMNNVTLSGVTDDNSGNEFGIFANSFKKVSIMLPAKVAYADSVGGTSKDFSVKVLS